MAACQRLAAIAVLLVSVVAAKAPVATPGLSVATVRLFSTLKEIGFICEDGPARGPYWRKKVVGVHPASGLLFFCFR
jgi:hypothetical protein